MADFGAFNSSEPPNFDEDPAADFLAREQDQLASLDDDLNFGNDNANAYQQQDDFGDFSANDNDGQQQIEYQQPVDDFGFSDDVPQDHNSSFDSQKPHADPYAAVSSIDKQRVEPEKIRRWREEQKERLTKKDAEADKKREQWREVASKELEDWYKHRAEQLEKNKHTNKESEAAFIEQRDEKMPGGEWERICRLCDFNPKNSRNTKDVSRMRSILLQLKQNPVAVSSRS